jgi:ribonuclease P protein component
MPLESVAGGWDMVFIVRKGAVNSSYSRLQESVYDLLKRAGLMNGDINNDSIGQND